jgi:hypothetical protein
MRWLVLAIGMFAASHALAQDARPFVFTHAHNNTVQPVAAGVPVQVQLPAGPVRWAVDPVGQNAELTGSSVVASPGRVPGSFAVQVFDFRLPGPGPAVILIQPMGEAGRDMRHHGHGDIHGHAFDAPFSLTLEPQPAKAQ